MWYLYKGSLVVSVVLLAWNFAFAVSGLMGAFPEIPVEEEKFLYLHDALGWFGMSLMFLLSSVSKK